MTLTTTFTAHTVDADRDLELVRDLPITPAAAFAAWTDPTSIPHWFAPRPFSTTRCEIDLRPGGTFRTVMADPDGNEMFDGAGCILQVVSDQLLVWTSALTTGFRPQQDDMPFTAILEFSPNGTGGCTYRAIAVHQDAAGRAQHESMGFHDGWSTVVDQLVEHVGTN